MCNVHVRVGKNGREEFMVIGQVRCVPGILVRRVRMFVLINEWIIISIEKEKKERKSQLGFLIHIAIYQTQ